MTLPGWLRHFFSPMTTKTLYHMASGQPCLTDMDASGKVVRIHFLGRSQDDGDGAKSSHGDRDYQPDTTEHQNGHAFDADAIPFAVYYPQFANVAGIHKCRVRVTKLATGKAVEMVAADRGPSNGFGEVSSEGNRRLGNSGSPTSGGDSHVGYLYEFFPGQPALVDGVSYAVG